MSRAGGGSERVAKALRELASLAERTAEGLAAPVAEITALVVEALRSGRTLFFCGNGGSAADAQHLAAEYVVRFARQRPGWRALALTTDSSILTAASNDLGFDEVFARQVEALGRAGDILFLHSTSGESRNLLRAASVARERGVTTVALLARGGGRLRGEVDHALVVETDVTARAQEIHLALGHAICDEAERALHLEDSVADSAEEGGIDAEGLLDLLEHSRRREKTQALFYRALAAEAGSQGDEASSERFNELHADEQHHLSRLTARVLELGGAPADLRGTKPLQVELSEWENMAREREAAEVAWYEAVLEHDLDAETAEVVGEILESERHHHAELRGKWMSA